MPRHRPLIVVLLIFAMGIGIARAMGFDRLQTGPSMGVATISLILSGILLLLPQKKRWQTIVGGVILTLTLCALGMMRYAQQRLPIAIYHQKAEYTEEISGTIYNYPTRTDERTRFLLKPDYDVGLVQVFYTHKDHVPLSLHYGDRLRLTGSFYAPKPFEGFDYPGYLAFQGIWAIARVGKADEIERFPDLEGNDLLRIGERVRNAIFEHIDRFIPLPRNNMLKALLFGQRALLDESLEDRFRDAGVAHVLAVSGLHLGVLIGLFWMLFRYGGFTNTLTYLLIALLVGVYLVLVGFKVSLVRAALLFGFIALGHVLKERGWIISVQVDPLQGWSLAALIILFITPQALWDVGFQLSFAATGSILLSLPLLQNSLQRWRLHAVEGEPFVQRLARASKRILITLVFISLAAQVGVLPIIAIHFHKLYVGTLLSNLLVVPLVTLALWGGVAFIFLGSISGINFALGQGLDWMLSALTQFVTFLSLIPGMVVEIPTVSAAWSLLYYGALILVVLWLERLCVHASSLPRASTNASVKS